MPYQLWRVPEGGYGGVLEVGGKVGRQRIPATILDEVHLACEKKDYFHAPFLYHKVNVFSCE